MKLIVKVSPTMTVKELKSILPSSGGYVRWNYKGTSRAILIRKKIACIPYRI